MNSIAKLKVYDAKDLLHLLQVCSKNLAMAYLEIPEQSWFLTSEEARRACEYLSYAIHKQCPDSMVH